MLLWWINACVFCNSKTTIFSYFKEFTGLEQYKVSDLTLFLSDGASKFALRYFSEVTGLEKELVVVTVLEKFYWTGQVDFDCSWAWATQGILTWECASWWWEPDVPVSSWIYSTDLEYSKRESVPDIPLHRPPDSLWIYGTYCFNIPHVSKPFHPWENTCGLCLILKTCESFDTCLNNASLWKV